MNWPPLLINWIRDLPIRDWHVHWSSTWGYLRYRFYGPQVVRFFSDLRSERSFEQTFTGGAYHHQSGLMCVEW